MLWLRRRAWWLLLTMTVLVAVIGFWPLIISQILQNLGRNLHA